MITPSFALTATERVLPKLALDFTTASLDSRVTFTRTGNTATVTNASGYVVPINANLPRFDYDSISLVCKGLLIEEARTNVFTYSSDFTNAIWTKVRLSAPGTLTTAPDNTNSAYKIVEDASAATTHFFRQDFIVTSGVNYSWTIFAKAAERDQIALRFPADFGVFPNADAVVFTLTGNGTTTVIAGSPSSYSITKLSNGWYRCSISSTAAATDTGVFRHNLAVSDNITYSGDGTSGLYVWGAQVEAGAFPTSYIPTTTTTVTRNADVATMTGTNFSSWFNASEGAFYSEAVVSRQVSAAGTGVYVASNAVTNSMAMFYRGSGATGAQVVDGGATQADLSPTGVLTANQVFKSVLAYKANDFAASGNAGTVVTDATGTVPTLDRLFIGTNVNYLNGHVRKISYYPQRLINAEVQAFSK